jgi:hypothetical protein
MVTIQYTKELKEFVDKMEEKFGYTPIDFSHHVLVSYETNRYAFAYANPEKKWFLVNVYDQLDFSEIYIMFDAIKEGILEFMRNTPLPDLLEIEPGAVLQGFRSEELRDQDT